MRFTGPESAGGSGSIVSGNNGLSVSTIDPTKLVYGQDVGQVGNPATYLSIREHPLDGFYDLLTLQPGGQLFKQIACPAVAGPGRVPWQEEITATLNSDGLSYNYPMVFGWNPFRGFDPLQSGQHISMEPNFVQGGVQTKELHYQVSFPNGDECRLFSHTLLDVGSIVASQGVWDFRADTSNFRLLDNTTYFSCNKTGATVIGSTPVLAIQDTAVGGATAQLESVNGVLQLGNTPLVIFGHAGNKNLTLEQFGGTAGLAAMTYQMDDGNEQFFISSGSTAAAPIGPRAYYMFRPYAVNQVPFCVYNSGSVAISQGNLPPADDPSVLLGMQSITAGFLPSPMTTVQKLAIPAPKEGVMVYDLTLHQLSYFNATTWINV